MERARAILLGHTYGSLAELKRALARLKLGPRDIRVGVDSGTELWRRLGARADFAVGDWDSLRTPARQLRGIPHLTLPREKDRSDLFYACGAALNAGATEIICLALSGGRPDHHLGVLADLSALAEGEWMRKRSGKRKLDAIRLIGGDAEYFFIGEATKPWSARLSRGTLVSIFALGGKARGVSLEGFAYPLVERKLALSSRGLSNVVRGRARISVRKGALVIVVPY